MKQEIIDIIHHEFSQEDRESVIEEMESIKLEHVMAKSEENLKNTLLSILKLSKGNTKEIKKFTQCAKEDFRDVIYWASIQ